MTTTTTKLPGLHAETGYALTAEPGAEGLVPQVVTTHIYCWVTLRPPSLGQPGAYDHHRAYRNDTIWVSPQERDRGQGFGGLADPENAQEGIDAVDALAGPATDEELAEMDAGELAGYVVQNPGEAQRVYELELDREVKKRRKTILRATGRDPDAYDETTGQYGLLADPGDGGAADHLDTSSGAGPRAVG